MRKLIPLLFLLLLLPAVKAEWIVQAPSDNGWNLQQSGNGWSVGNVYSEPAAQSAPQTVSRSWGGGGGGFGGTSCYDNTQTRICTLPDGTKSTMNCINGEWGDCGDGGGDSVTPPIVTPEQPESHSGEGETTKPPKSQIEQPKQPNAIWVVVVVVLAVIVVIGVNNWLKKREEKKEKEAKDEK